MADYVWPGVQTRVELALGERHDSWGAHARLIHILRCLVVAGIDPRYAASYQVLEVGRDFSARTLCGHRGTRSGLRVLGLVDDAPRCPKCDIVARREGIDTGAL